MRRRIGIVGAGIAGLHLALYLQKHGVDATIITDRAPEDYRDIRLLNTVAHHHVTIAREDYLGVNHWTDPKDHYYYHDHVFNFPQPLSFRGDFSRPSRAVDYRIYLPALMEDFAGAAARSNIAASRRAISRRWSPVSICWSSPPARARSASSSPTGRNTRPIRSRNGGLRRALYRRAAARSDERDALGVAGHGEMIVIPTITFDGIANALLMENVPGGDMEELATLSYDDEPASISCSVLLGKLEKHHPTTYDRIDTARFDLAQPQDLLQGGVVPTVRNTVVEFDGGKCAIALGDVHSIVDPMMGQGANVASYAAFVLGEEIVNADALDARFCEKVDLKRQDRVLAASRWTNIMLQPPSEALGMLIGAMSQNQALADEFTENFNYPDRQWDRIASPSASRPGSSACRRRAEPVRATA